MSSSKFIICFAAIVLLPLCFAFDAADEDLFPLVVEGRRKSNNMDKMDQITRHDLIVTTHGSNKRAKLNLDSTLLWHCHPRHINKKRIKKLQHDGLSKSTDDESFEKCVSCLSSKIAQLCQDKEQATSSPSLTTLAVMFLNHLKEHGIVSQRTPPYTPQHNGISRRINRTLLDMVCSMMSQTTLPKSFWDYALESAVRILNMILTKKVEKTSYEDTQRKQWVTPSTIVESDITP
ncbi:retrotransposon protein, putative, ty1-copia subclass [Tanacetum coccineum]